MKVVVFGLWHLGTVTAACAAAAGNRVVGLDFEAATVGALAAGNPPVAERGLPELMAEQTAAGRLSFTADAGEAMRGADVLWVTIDTPVDEDDRADADNVRRQLDALAAYVPAGCVVLISSQVPTGFTRALCREWRARRVDAYFAYSPENLRLGNAIAAFRNAERVVVGVSDKAAKPALVELFGPFTSHIEWMGIEAAEMTKHALNAFLATSVAFANELARLCEQVGADAKEVERGLRSEPRVGPRAYVSPGAPFAGGTLARDVRFLTGLGQRHGVDTPLFDGVIASNDRHKLWVRHQVDQLLGRGGGRGAAVAVLGLSYKAGTDTLRRSLSVELCRWLRGNGAQVRAHDPQIRQLPDDLCPVIDLRPSVAEALDGADLAVVTTDSPEYRRLAAADFTANMRTARVIDENWVLAAVLADDPRITYVATGRSGTPHAT